MPRTVPANQLSAGATEWNTDAITHRQCVMECKEPQTGAAPFAGAPIDTVNGRMHVTWLGGMGDTDLVYESFSDDGLLWSLPVRVSHGDASGIQTVNVDLSARGGKVYVSYGKRRHPEQDGGFVQQQVVTSTDSGRSFGAPSPIGPISQLKYAAQAGGYFPGDYIGTAISKNLLSVVWAVSSKPPASSSSPYHQVIRGSTLRR